MTAGVCSLSAGFDGACEQMDKDLANLSLGITQQDGQQEGSLPSQLESRESNVYLVACRALCSEV